MRMKVDEVMTLRTYKTFPFLLKVSDLAGIVQGDNFHDCLSKAENCMSCNTTYRAVNETVFCLFLNIRKRNYQIPFHFCIESNQ